MIIINAGVPRSGTVLVNAWVRHLIDRPTRQENLAGDGLEGRLRAVLAEPHDDDVVIVHAHDWTEPTLDLVGTRTGFLNVRDPRDVAISLAALHDLTLAEAAAVTLDAFASFQMAVRRTSWMVLRYETLVSDPATLLRCVAEEIGACPSAERLAEILAATSADRHARIMRRVASGSGPRRAVNNPRRTLFEDPSTLINDRHIQSGAIGRWRTELSRADAAALGDALAGPIRACGYNRTRAHSSTPEPTEGPPARQR